MKKIVFSIIFSLVLAEDRIYYYSDVAMGSVTLDGQENEFIIPPTWPGGHKLTDISLDSSKLLYITESNYQEIVMLDIESMDSLMTDLNTEGCPECENYFPEYALFTNNDNEIIFVDDENLYKYSLLDSSVTILIEDEDDWGDGMMKKITQSPDKTKLAYLSKNSNITQLRVFDLLNHEISVIDNFINLNNDCNENNTYWGTGDYLYYTSCISDELSSLFKIHISNGEPAQLLESDIYFIFSTSKQSQLEKLVYTKNSWNSESYRIIDLTSHEIINPENMSGIYEGSQIYLNYQAWSPDHSKVALSGIRASGGWGGVIFEAYPVIFIYDLVMDSIESSIYIAYGNAAGGDYFIPSFWVQDNLGGFITIEDIENQSTNEDEPIILNISASSELGLELSYYAESNTLAMPVSMESTTLTIGLQENWSGVGTVSVFVFDENGLFDTTSFLVTVLPVNDAPTIEDIDDITIDEDESINITLSSEDVDGDALIYSFHLDNYNVALGIEEDTLSITATPNFNGDVPITMFVSDNELSDSALFVVTVNPVNDSPMDFELIYPTILDTIQISSDTDETIPFLWHESFDPDSDVSYKITTTLDYFGNVYTSEYDNISDTTYGVSAYEYAILMTNLNLPRWNIDYVIEASDGEYTVISEAGEFVLKNSTLSIDNTSVPNEFALRQNYPNPFNPTTQISYALPKDELVSISIYDMSGRLVRMLVNSSQTAGYKSIQWNATNDRNEPVSAGLYLYTIQAGEFRQTKKMVLLK